MDDYSMSPTEAHYSHPNHQQHHQWSAPHLLPPSAPHLGRGPSSFPTPVSPSAASDYVSANPNAPFYHNQDDHQGDTSSDANTNSTGALSLNISTLSVTSPTNLSPVQVNPSSTTTLSPATPISPHPFHNQHQQNTNTFQYHASPSRTSSQHSLSEVYTNSANIVPTSSRPPSSASSSSSLPRKRSFTLASSASATSSTTALAEVNENDDEGMYDDLVGSTSFDDVSHANYGGGSPVDGHTSGGSGEDTGGGNMGVSGSNMMLGMGGGLANGFGVAAKPVATTNNFVTKLYQMISDPKSAHFIAWTEHGTSFVVSNVGEFSRSILGSHFKHNNFSSFVRQLNMYGFHKINRTPRAQRTSSDAQTWEFSHGKFLRGRPDLLDEIKRKALEPDPAIKQRVELPGEVAAQLSAMRDENRRVWEQLASEKRKTERLVNVVGRLWDVVGKAWPGSIPPFPADILEASESPNIYVTSPVDRFPSHAQQLQPQQQANGMALPPLSTLPPLPLSHSHSLQSLHSLASLTPNSSPTTADFPHHHHAGASTQVYGGHHPQQQQHNPNHHGPQRQQSLHPNSFSRGASPVEMYMDDGQGGTVQHRKRQRTADDVHISIPASASNPNLHLGSVGGLNTGAGRRTSRARSDSAPLGHYGGGAAYAHNSYTGGGLGMSRPRSGSEMHMVGVLPNIGGMSRGGMGARSTGMGIGGVPTGATGVESGATVEESEPGMNAPPMLPILTSMGTVGSVVDVSRG